MILGVQNVEYKCYFLFAFVSLNLQLCHACVSDSLIKKKHICIVCVRTAICQKESCSLDFTENIFLLNYFEHMICLSLVIVNNIMT